MVANVFKTIAPAIGAEQTLAALKQVRERTLMLVSHLPARDLEAVHSPLMSPLVWDLAHIAAYEDLWLVHRHTGEPLLRGDLAAVYDAFETPRAVRGEVKLLDVPQTLLYMAEVRRRTERAVERVGLGDGFLHELVLRHELQHTETMLQTMALSGLLPSDAPFGSVRGEAEEGAPSGDAGALPGDAGAPPGEHGPEPAKQGQGGSPPGRQERRSGAAWVDFAGGRSLIGAEEGAFAYDNERPRHEVALEAFRIARDPVSVLEWSEFEQEGGYERRELWSAQGWEWRLSADPARHPSQPRAGEAPVCHVCFHEAEAYARFSGARLPSEVEWEHAATAEGAPLRALGEVWEWTSSVFDGYPGFVAHPYREYSEVFFRKDYRVLRGGSWATHARVATATFRNWDLPQRRQIFAGLRLASDSAGR